MLWKKICNPIFRNTRNARWNTEHLVQLSRKKYNGAIHLRAPVRLLKLIRTLSVPPVPRQAKTEVSNLLELSPRRLAIPPQRRLYLIQRKGCIGLAGDLRTLG